MASSSSSSFVFPQFYTYPPFFTLQPVKESRERQSGLWGSLILSYCKHHKVYSLQVGGDSPLFYNPTLPRRLSSEAQVAFLDDLVAQGSAEWLDKGKRECRIYWKRLAEWAELIREWAVTFGMQGGVVAVDDLIRGDDVRRTEFFGIDRGVLLKALALLEAQGKARLFAGENPEEEGVKFL